MQKETESRVSGEIDECKIEELKIFLKEAKREFKEMQQLAAEH